MGDRYVDESIFAIESRRNTELEQALVEAREAIRAGLNYFSDTDCVELKKPTEGCETCKTISRFRSPLKRS